ncbi:MAG TPA: bifunctional dTDP-4-dehydrorhamnose 3,5-epimerase family protein/NAD(P)-dependent oxidoreductase [Candidatus Microsaccharimonas sp.]|jgi:dTDP-4-dehydrorhamnose 3,5-epimerase
MSESKSHEIEFGKELQLHETNIPGLVWLDLPVHGDNRGWFKENWQQEKMTTLGLPDFGPRQNNISFNATRGTTRGIHAEPWDKYVSVATGKIYGAWTDLREGPTFGTSFELEIDPSKAIFVPRGVGNAFQALEDGTAYSYLVNDHWVPGGENYAFLNLADTTANIQWPIPLDQAELSDKDRAHPALDDIEPIKPRKILVTGANGQLGKALQIEFPDAEFVDRSTFDIADKATWGDRNWRQYSTIINAGAYTKVDIAETPEGRKEAWAANATAVKNLAQLAIENQLTLVHVSSDYVFDGTSELHTEDESFSPLGVYGQTKAAGDIAAATVPRHYIARTSWVVGEGNNFVKTMAKLAADGINPAVVDDQIGRLSFTEDIAKGIKHLLETNAPYGTYNISNDGEPASWRDVAKKVFELTGNDPDRVGVQTTGEFIAKKLADGNPVSPRPLQSTLDITKIIKSGFIPTQWEDQLIKYIEVET